ncbi:hypothetical protein ACFXHB_43735, partial [Kitasatospora sp. NPDC059327]
MTWNWEYLPGEQHVTAGASAGLLPVVEQRAAELVRVAEAPCPDGTAPQGTDTADTPQSAEAASLYQGSNALLGQRGNGNKARDATTSLEDGVHEGPQRRGVALRASQLLHNDGEFIEAGLRVFEFGVMSFDCLMELLDTLTC